MEEIKMVRVIINGKFNAYEDLTGNNPNAIFVSQEDLDQIGKTKCFDLENNCVIDYDNTIDKIIEHKNELRARRVPLLKAFDVYKSSVAYGVEFENEEQRVKMMTWYNLLLALDEDAMREENIPERVKYYL